MNATPIHNLADVLFQAVEQSPSLVVITDLDGRIEYVNPVFCQTTGYTAAELLGRHTRDLKSGEMSPATYAELWRDLKAGKDWQGEFHNRKKDGTFYWERAALSPVRDAQGAVGHYLKVAEDITRHKELESELKDAQKQRENLVEQLHHASLRDPLTGLLNRRGFEEEFRRAWHLGVRQKRPTGLLVMDLDHFKVLNDTYGHLVGDQVLQEASRLVASETRAADIACRYGGDELLVILPLASVEETHRVGERLREAFQTHVFCRNAHDVHVTISVGAACSSDSELPAQRLLARADQALYRAKRSGRNRLCVWDPQADAAIEGHATVDGKVAPTMAGAGPARVLIVDDEPTAAKVMSAMLQRAGYRTVVVASGQEARALDARERGLLDVVLMDIQLGDGSGIEVLKELRRADDTIVGIIVTGYATVDNLTETLRGGAMDCITKPFHTEQLLAAVARAMQYRRLLVENRRYLQHLEEMVAERSAALTRALGEVRQSYRAVLEMLAYILERREHKTGEHCKRVARMAQVLAREMGLGEDEVDLVNQGALMHDIGKVAIPDEVLLKQASLTAEEWKLVKSHPHLGYEIVRTCPALERVAEIVYSHQEHYDGSGYPRGLQGDAICLEARIFTVVDAYDAIRSKRSYSTGQTAEVAVAEIVRQRGRQFDPAVVDAFQRCQAHIEACFASEPKTIAPPT